MCYGELSINLPANKQSQHEKKKDALYVRTSSHENQHWLTSHRYHGIPPKMFDT